MRVLTAALVFLVSAPAAFAQESPQGSLAAYQAARLYIEGVENVTSTSGGRVLSARRTWYALQGDSRVSERAFYELVGRDDLAARVRRRDGTRIGLAVGGVVVSLVGAVVASTGLNAIEVRTPPRRPGGMATIDRIDDKNRLYLGGGIASAGVLMTTVAFTIGPKRVTHVQAAAEMAAHYNAQLDQPPPEPEPGPVLRDTQP